MTKKKLRRLSITGFRGVRHSISIDFSCNYHSILIYGANAKGKSSIGDAFEWFFNGEVKELTKEGCTREDYRHRLLEDDEDTIVSLELSDAELNSEFKLCASRIQNQSNESVKFAEYLRVSKDELIILRHKDLKQFVDKTKGEKRKQIAQLIGMEGWEKIRNDMGAVENRLSTILAQKKQAIKDRQVETSTLIKEDEFSFSKCWKYAEKQAKILGLCPTIASLEDLRETDEKAKESTKGSDRSKKIAQLIAAEKLLQDTETTPPILEELEYFEDLYNMICSSPSKVICVQLNILYEQGASLLEGGKWVDDTCPLCGANIAQDELLSHIKEHQEQNKEILEEVNKFEQTKNRARKELKTIGTLVEEINRLQPDDVDEIEKLKEFGTEVALAVGSAQALVEQPLKPKTTVSVKEIGLRKKLDELLKHVVSSKSKIKKIKEELAPTKEESDRIEAFQNLSTLSSHVTRITAMEEEISPLEIQVASLSAFNCAFQELRRNTMGKVLETISDDVSRYFLSLHPGEGFDDIRLSFLPEDDGVEFHIYYKGEEITPPRKFLSESYLNGLGVCLFLSTMRAFNQENAFVVLDDIVNSFDAEHRADLARLLVTELSDHQLVVLTHDSVWFDVFRRLAKSGWQHKRITRWSYEEGVEIETSQSEGLADCRESLDSGRVEIAAPRVRTYIESRLKCLLKKVGGRVRFREGSANDERSSGELLFELKRYLMEEGFFDFVDQTSFDQLEASTFITNFGSHDRPPAPVSLSIGDVQFALERIKELEETFICPKCKKKIWNIVDRNFKMQCKCGKYKL